MNGFLRPLLGLAAALALSTAAAGARAQDANAVVEKGIKALGGEEALSKIKAATWKTKTTITFNGNENQATTTTTVQGLDHFRQELDGEFNGNAFRAVTVLNGDKGSRSFGGNQQELDKDALANQKRTVYLTLIPMTLVQLKRKDFKLESAPDETVDGKPAAGVKVTGPDGKDFKLYFDKESGLPVRMVAKVAGFMGNEFTQETTFSDYKDVAGVRKAMRIVSKRDGQPFMTQQITEFKLLDTVDPKTFEGL